MQPAVQLPITSACRARHGYSKAVYAVPTTFTVGAPDWNELHGNRMITKTDTAIMDVHEHIRDSGGTAPRINPDNGGGKMVTFLWLYFRERHIGAVTGACLS
jgi:hypothetical protein